VLSSIPSAIPVIGDWIVTFVRGGEKITEVTLSRYFAFHAAFLPITAVILISAHIFLVIRKNLSSHSEKVRDRKNVPPSEFKRDVYPEGTPYYPDYLLRQTYMALAFLAFVFFAISFVPDFFLTEIAYMEADPSKTPEMIRPSWYFSAAFQFLKIVPDKFTGIITIAFVVGLVIVWPFLDTQGEERRLWKRPALMGFFVTGVVFWIIFTVWGRFF
jgi:ubiquinol-cytochrome c reductase cytochrome b subunit